MSHGVQLDILAATVSNIGKEVKEGFTRLLEILKGPVGNEGVQATQTEKIKTEKLIAEDSMDANNSENDSEMNEV